MWSHVHHHCQILGYDSDVEEDLHINVIQIPRSSCIKLGSCIFFHTTLSSPRALLSDTSDSIVDNLSIAADLRLMVN